MALGRTKRVRPDRGEKTSARRGMVAARRPVWLVLLFLGLITGTLFAAPTPIMPVDEVRPGMKGVGRTVFQGDTISEFGVEILAVLKGSRPKGDIILFRGDGPVLDHAGIIAGMSGSPVYVDGRLIGAVAFAYPYCKDPIGGITPIGEMLALLSLPPTFMPDEAGGVVNSPPATLDGRGSGVATESGGASGEFAREWDAFLKLGKRAVARADAGEAGESARAVPSEGTGAPEGLQTLAMPISLSGWDPAMQPMMEGALRRLGFVGTPAAGGGASADTGSGRSAAAPLLPGAGVGVSLVRGDANLAAIGTVTYVDGDRVLCFGHPMVQSGPVALPLTAAWIHTIMPNLEVSYKVGASTGLVGGLWEDRRSGVAGRLGRVPEMLPVRVLVESPGDRSETFRYSLVRHPTMTPMFLPWIVSNSYLATGWAQGDATARSDITVYYNGTERVDRIEHFSTDTPAQAFGSEIMLPATILLINPFAAARLDSVVVKLTYERRNLEAFISAVTCVPTRVAVGDTIHLAVTLEPHRTPAEQQRLDLVVPAGWAGKRLQLVVCGAGESLESDRERAPDKYTPRSLTELSKMIPEIPNQGDLVVRVLAHDTGSLVAGGDLPALPPSLAQAGEGTGGRAVIRPTGSALLQERRIETPWVLSGKEAVEVEVTR
jgi:hypothetical protein